jgi:Kef-type K+ transport system membrane component KefB
MSSFLQLAIELVIILLAAKLAGYLAVRLGQPSVLGELVVGVLLGPSLINILGLPFINSASLAETVSELSQIGVLMLMFLAGLELHLSELTNNRKVSLLSSVGGEIFSIVFGWLAGYLFGMSHTAALLLGIALGATSVSISARTLMEMGRLRSPVGLTLLGAAVLDDILSILTFSIFLALTSEAEAAVGLVWIVARMVLFLTGAVLFGLFVLPLLARWINRLHISQGPLVFAIAMLLVYGIAAELVGDMAAIIGTFLAGLMFARTPQKAIIEQGMSSLAYAFFIPIFFVNIGLTVNLHNFVIHDIWLVLAVTLAALAGKFLGVFGGSRLGGFKTKASLQLGAGMVARGEVTLIVAAEGISVGLFSNNAFSAIVVAVLISTLVAPPLLRIFSRQSASDAENLPEKPVDDKKKVRSSIKDEPWSKL